VLPIPSSKREEECLLPFLHHDKRESHPAQVSHDLPLLLLFLLTGEPCYHGGQHLQALLEDTDLRDAIALPASQEIFADLIDRAKKQVWRLQDHVGTRIEFRRQGGRDTLRRLLAILRNEHLGNQYAQFEISKALPRCLTHPGDFLLKGLGTGVHQILPLAISASSGDKPDTVCLSGCD
jgi:hypothetical protein